MEIIPLTDWLPTHYKYRFFISQKNETTMKENQDKRINPTSTNQSILYCKVYSQLLVSDKQMNESSASLDLSAL